MYVLTIDSLIRRKEDPDLTKNKKIVIASVGMLFILISTVLILRSPDKPNPIKPSLNPPQETVIQTPAPVVKDEKVYDESHQKVSKIIDSAASLTVEKAPGLWAKVMDSGKWFMEFDTKHALILLGFGLFLCTIFIGNKKNKKS